MHRSLPPFDPEAGSEMDQPEEQQLLAGRARVPRRSRMASAILRILVGTRAARQAPARTEPADREQPVEWAMRLMS
jgi:hypothetical protein